MLKAHLALAVASPIHELAIINVARLVCDNADSLGRFGTLAALAVVTGVCFDKLCGVLALLFGQ